MSGAICKLPPRPNCGEGPPRPICVARRIRAEHFRDAGRNVNSPTFCQEPKEGKARRSLGPFRLLVLHRCYITSLNYRESLYSIGFYIFNRSDPSSGQPRRDEDWRIELET